MLLVEKKMNLFDVPKNCYLMHCISSDFALEAGIAKEFRRRGCAEELNKRYHRNSWNGRGYCVQTSINGFAGAYHLITKQKYWQKPTYETVGEALKMAHYYVNQLIMNKGHVTIAMPRIGYGLDKLKWDKVKTLIEKEFENEDIEIIACSL